jgi:hypothetical protein
MPDPAAPLKSSLKTVDQPDGGPGTAVAGAASTAAAAVWARAGTARGGGHHGRCHEHGTGRRGELGVPVPDQEPEAVRAIPDE